MKKRVRTDSLVTSHNFVTYTQSKDKKMCLTTELLNNQNSTPRQNDRLTRNKKNQNLARQLGRLVKNY